MRGVSRVRDAIEKVFASSVVTDSEGFEVGAAGGGRRDGAAPVMRSTPTGLEVVLLLGRRAMVVGISKEEEDRCSEYLRSKSARGGDVWGSGGSRADDGRRGDF